MISLFIVPVLLCGIIWIKINPKQKARISTYQGWIIYLYATFYGVLALSASWIVLEYFFPIIFKHKAEGINELLNNFGISLKVSEDYLDRIAKYVINKPPIAMPAEDAYSNFITARATIISAISVIFTFLISLFVLSLRSSKKSKMNRVLNIYEHDSPTDYQLMLIAARIAENESKIEDLEELKEFNVYFNLQVKNYLRNFNRSRFKKPVLYFLYSIDRYGLKKSFFYLFRNKSDSEKAEIKKEAFEFFNDEALYRYKEFLINEKNKLRRLKNNIPDESLYAQITLDSKKVYIGIPKQIGLPNEKSIGNEEISLLPVYSGYRDSEDMSIIITNKYTLLEGDFYTDINNVVIKKDKISSVSAFSMKYYKVIQGVDDKKDFASIKRSIKKFNRKLY